MNNATRKDETMKLTIERKMSGTGSIHDYTSEYYERMIDLGDKYQFAVVLPSFYGDISSRHATRGAAIEAARRHVSSDCSCRIIDRKGKVYDLDYDGLIETEESFVTIQ